MKEYRCKDCSKKVKCVISGNPLYSEAKVCSKFMTRDGKRTRYSKLGDSVNEMASMLVIRIGKKFMFAPTP